MEPAFRSLLYREPRLYDLVFPDADDSIGRMCREAFRRYLSAPPASALDIGCGTGRHLAALAGTIADCWGVDLLAENVAYANAARPRLRVLQGDMRAVRLGRAFDLVTSFGNALSYALTDADLTRTMETYAAHAHAGTLLIVDTLNARSYLDGDGFTERIEGQVDTPEFQATSVSMHTLDRAARILRRTRVWRIPGRAAVEDYAEYRLLYPDELARQLEAAGFEMLAMFDNREFRASDLAGQVSAAPDAGGMRGRKVYAFARKR
ncbi:MAG TPA: class I SAM-dependent methyltransferase [Candidatus Methylomirabilis sp.]|nr:class I SAM-dependent methyltransferase [Candidatus Methylomirabilis sp.]